MIHSSRSIKWLISLVCIFISLIWIGSLSLILGLLPHENVVIFIVVPVLTIGPAMAVFGFLIFKLVNRLQLAIDNTYDATLKFTDGELGARITNFGGQNSHHLEQAFNNMASTISDLVHSLSGERDKLSAILETMADGVIVIDPKGMISLINQAAESLLDLGTKEAIGRPLTENIRDYELSTLVAKSLETKNITQKEFDLIRQRRFISAISTPLKGIDQGAVLLTLQDLTDIRRLDITRREFVTNVSHELRSPLASVKALTDTLSDGVIDNIETAQEFLERINSEIDRMTTLVNDLLDLSRLESGHHQINLIPMNLKALIDESIYRISHQTKTRNISVKNHIIDNFPLAVGDKAKLEQVFANLLDNALKAIQDRETISITGQVSDRFVEISVTDTGIGIPAEDIPHVFERFYKVDRSRRNEGTGLGLAIVKHIIQAHGGELSIKSQEGIGTTFSFTLSKA